MVGLPTNVPLTEAARLLDHPQHRLIYLCEQRVVRPELADASGRGSSRRFSAKNLLELAIALHLRDLRVPVPVLQAVVHVLGVFEKRSECSELPDCLLVTPAPDLRILIRDGRFLYASLRTASGAPRLFGGIDLQTLRGGGRGLEDLERQSASGKGPEGDHAGPSDGAPDGSWRWRLEVRVTRIALELFAPTV